MATPKILYKYISLANAKATLEGRRVKVSPIRSFNDPFEMYPVYRDYVPREAFYTFVLSKINIDALYKGQPNSAKRLNRKQLRAMMHKKKSELYKVYLARDMKRDAISMQYKLEERARHVLAFCVSERKDILLSWAHYGDQHKGVVLGINHDEWTKLHGAFEKVDYVEDRPPLNMVGFFNPDTEATQAAQISSLYTSKSKEWHYEEEWRYLLNPQHPTIVREKLPDDSTIVFAPILPEMISEIVFGCRVTPADAKQFLIVATANGYGNASACRAVQSKDKYALCFETIWP